MKNSSPYSRLVLITEDEYLKFNGIKSPPSLQHSYRLQAAKFQEKRAMRRSAKQENSSRFLEDKIKQITSTFPKNHISKAILLLNHLHERDNRMPDNIIDLIRYAISDGRTLKKPVPSNWTLFTKQLLDTETPVTLLSFRTSDELGLNRPKRKRRNVEFEKELNIPSKTLNVAARWIET